MEQKKNQWHPGFAAAIRMELKENREGLTFEEEHPLSKKPLQIDMLIIKNEKNVKIKNKIGRIFRRYNIVEYKSPDDSMSVDTFYKVVGYACLYKVSSEYENAYDAEEITITLVRQRYPITLMRYLKECGYIAERVFPGIYYISGKTMFPIQLLVTKDLDKDENIWLHSLRNDISRETYTELLASVEKLGPKDRELYGEAILQVVTNANDVKIEKWKENNKMACEALQRIMAPELEASMLKGELKGEIKGKIEGKILAYSDVGIPIETIAEKVSLSVHEVEKILAKN